MLQVLITQRAVLHKGFLLLNQQAASSADVQGECLLRSITHSKWPPVAGGLGHSNTIVEFTSFEFTKIFPVHSCIQQI